MKLIIVEKPIIAKWFVDQIGADLFKKKSGYWESNEYIITWPFHHLFKLDVIKPDIVIDNPDGFFSVIPLSNGLCPDCFSFSLKENSICEKQFEVIKSLVNREAVEEIIHAGDPDSDSEIMIRIVLHMAGCLAPVRRMDPMASVIFHADVASFSNLTASAKPLSEFDGLAREGFCNMYKNFVSGNDHPFVGLAPEFQIPFPNN